MRKKILKYFKSISFPPLEISVILLLFIVVITYVSYLKSSSKKQTVYVEVSIQRSDWWRSPALIPSMLLDHIKTGSTDNQKNLEVLQIRYFTGLQQTWGASNENRSVGSMILKIGSTMFNGKIYYNNQELLIGNPLVTDIAQTRLETLITNIQNEKQNDEYDHGKITVKIYNKLAEFINELKPDIELMDNTGFVYGKILTVFKEATPYVGADQWGHSALSRDPISYNVTMDIDMLIKQRNGKIIGFDGRPIAIGARFVINHPLLDEIDAFIINVER